MSESEENKKINMEWVQKAKSFALQTTSTARRFFDFASDKRLNIKSGLKSRPMILLEVIGTSTMRSLIIFSYIIFMVCIAFSFIERPLKTKKTHFRNEMVIKSPLDLNKQDISWDKIINVNLMDRFFNLYGHIKKYNNNHYLHLVFHVTLEKIEKNKNDNIKLESNIIFDKRNYRTKSRNIILISEENSPFGYYWEDKLFANKKGFDENIDLKIKVKLLNSSHVSEKTHLNISFVFEKKNAEFIKNCNSIGFILLLFTLLIFAIYLIILKFSFRIITEQKLIGLLFTSMVIFQISMLSFSIPFNFKRFSLTTNRYIFITIGNLMQTFSTFILASFILLIADLINRNYAQENKLSNLLSSFKIYLAITYAVSSLVSTIISTFWEITKNNTQKSCFVNFLYFFFTFLWMITSISWIIWITKLFWSAYQELQYWNYYSTRFRQLSFRFFVSVSWILILYIVSIWLVWFISGHKIFGTNTNPLSSLSTNILLTTYTFICAYVHLPLRKSYHLKVPVENKEYEDSGFCLEMAKMLCDLSWQVYRPLDKKKHKNQWPYYVDLKNHFDEHIFGNCKDYEVQWLIAKNSNMIALAFRGTISAVNVTTNIRLYRWIVNNNFWYTGDLRFVTPSQKRLLHGCTLIHAGFMQAYLAIRKKILEQFNSLRGKEKVVCFTGHSLGAALATLCCLEIRCRFDVSVRIYTFGSPRVGSKSFTKLFRTLIGKNNSFRIVYEGDIVTSYPTQLAYYYHIDSEVYVNRSGSFIFAPNLVEKSLLPGKTRIDHHPLIHYKNAIDIANKQLEENVKINEKIIV